MNDERQKKIEDFVEALAKKCEDRFGCRAKASSIQLIGLDFDCDQSLESIADFLKKEIDQFEITPYAELKHEDTICFEGDVGSDGIVKITRRYNYSISFSWDGKKPR